MNGTNQHSIVGFFVGEKPSSYHQLQITQEPENVSLVNNLLIRLIIKHNKSSLKYTKQLRLDKETKMIVWEVQMAIQLN